MKSIIGRIQILIAVLLTPLILFSCMVEQNIALNPDFSGEWSIEGEAQAFAGDAFDDLAILGGYDDASALYDEALDQARRDMGKRDDIASFSIRRSSAHGWSAEIMFSNLEDLLGKQEAGGIISLATQGDVSTLRLRFDRDSASGMETLVPLMRNPTLSLFNPAATAGIDEETYISDILGFTFGEENIPAIRLARISLEISLPGPVTDITGGRSTGKNSVRFEMPFSRFMTPDQAIIWSVSWRGSS